MRVSKDPEVRKQEIIDTAMKVFAEQGYEATSMKDIARAVNVASGLCYHYFQNKQELYETAVRQYAKNCSAPFVQVLSHRELPVRECIERIGRVWMEAEEGGSYAYESFFHQQGNEWFCRQLDLEMIREMQPCLLSYIEELNRRGEICVSDPEATARFLLHGQAGIIHDYHLPLKQKFQWLREMILKVLDA